MLRLKRVDVDFERCTTWVHADEAKGREAIGVPLNEDAMAVLSEEKGKQPRVCVHLQGPTSRAAEHNLVAQRAQPRRHRGLPLTASAHLRHRSRMQRNTGARKTALLRFRLQLHFEIGQKGPITRP